MGLFSSLKKVLPMPKWKPKDIINPMNPINDVKNVAGEVFGFGKPNATAKALQAQNKLAQQQALLSANGDVQNVTQFTDNSTDSTFSGSSYNRKKRNTSGYGVSVLNV